MKIMTMANAISEAQAEEMARDERVFVLGEDVGKMGGAFKNPMYPLVNDLIRLNHLRLPKV